MKYLKHITIILMFTHLNLSAQTLSINDNDTLINFAINDKTVRGRLTYDSLIKILGTPSKEKNKKGYTTLRYNQFDIDLVLNSKKELRRCYIYFNRTKKKYQRKVGTFSLVDFSDSVVKVNEEIDFNFQDKFISIGSLCRRQPEVCFKNRPYFYEKQEHKKNWSIEILENENHTVHIVLDENRNLLWIKLSNLRYY